MKIIYMGTPDFAVPSLEAVAARHQVVAVLTQPDRPAGRGHKLTPSPVKVVATNLGIPIYQPPNLKLAETKDLRETLRAYDADIFVVAAYGILLPKGILNMPRLGCINVHASLLPKYRGASPIHAALLNGDKEAGITIMHMDVGLDTGDMILKKSLDLPPGERFVSLHNRMAVAGAEVLLEALEQLENGTAPRTPQDDAQATHVGMIHKAHAHIDWSKPTAEIINMTCAYDPWPGPYTTYMGDTVKIWALESAEIPSDTPPGTIIEVNPAKGLLVKTGDGTAWVTEMQGGGSKRMPTTEYLKGRKIQQQEIFV